jgi:CheY-like chemotaxis protein
MSKIFRILLIEDLPSDAYLVERQLKKAFGRFELMTVDNKDDFIENFESFNPDIILSDYSLPGFSWSTALKVTREKSSGIPFLIVSSSTNPAIVEACLQSGVSGFVSKDNLAGLVPEMMRLLGPED